MIIAARYYSYPSGGVGDKYILEYEEEERTFATKNNSKKSGDALQHR